MKRSTYISRVLTIFTLIGLLVSCSWAPNLQDAECKRLKESKDPFDRASYERMC